MKFQVIGCPTEGFSIGPKGLFQLVPQILKKIAVDPGILSPLQ
jgi:hypothetical protein